MSKLHRLGSNYLPHLPKFAKLSPANTAGCTKYQIIRAKKSETFVYGKKFQFKHICIKHDSSFDIRRHIAEIQNEGTHDYKINVFYLADIEHSSSQFIHMPLKVGPSQPLKIWPPQPPKVAQALKIWPPKTVKSSQVSQIKASRQLHALLETPFFGHFPSPSHNI